MPATGQLMVTETAGKMQAISILISSIPLPQRPPKPEKQPEPPPPVLAVYPVTQIKPAAAVEMLSILFPAAKFTVDDQSDQVMANARPNEQEGIKAAIEQMEANRTGDQRPRLEVYNLEREVSRQLVEQLGTVMPGVQAVVDRAGERLLVLAGPSDQDKVREMLQKLDADYDASGTRQIVVYHPTALRS